MTESEELNRRELQEKAFAELRELAIGSTIAPVLENGCVVFCREYKGIEVLRVSERIRGTVVEVTKITVGKAGNVCVGFCRHDAEWLQNNINILKKLIDEIINSKDNSSVFGIDKEKIKEAKYALQDIQMYINMLFPFTS